MTTLFKINVKCNCTNFKSSLMLAVVAKPRVHRDENGSGHRETFLPLKFKPSRRLLSQPRSWPLSRFCGNAAPMSYLVFFVLDWPLASP